MTYAVISVHSTSFFKVLLDFRMNLEMAYLFGGLTLTLHEISNKNVLECVKFVYGYNFLCRGNLVFARLFLHDVQKSMATSVVHALYRQ